MTKRSCFFKINVRLLLTTLGAIILLSPLAVASGAIEEGQGIFQEKCSSCHSLGGGDKVGPDLAGVTGRRDKEFLKKIIVSPDDLANSSDPVVADLLKKYPVKMPDLGISDDQAEAIIGYLKTAQQGAPASAAQSNYQPAAQTNDQLPPGDAGTGRKLFVGETRFAAGGPACISCHSAGENGPAGTGFLGGGVLAADLTGLYAASQEAGTTAILRSLKFPVMKDVFAGRPLSDQEIAGVTAFFKEVQQEKAGSSVGALLKFVLFGCLGLIILLMLSQVLWRRRFYTIRKQLVRGSR